MSIRPAFVVTSGGARCRLRWGIHDDGVMVRCSHPQADALLFGIGKGWGRAFHNLMNNIKALEDFANDPYEG